MRKLKPGEVVALVAVMAIGSGNVHADENIPGQDPLATVEVNGTFTGATYTAPPIVDLSGPPTTSYQSTMTATQQQQVKHAISCAAAYAGTGAAGTPASHSGRAPNFEVYWVDDMVWGNKDGWLAASDVAPANAGPWTQLDGLTYGPQHKTWIYAGSTFNQTTAGLINTFAHEFSHEWGANDISSDPNYNAYIIGNNAAAAYKADGGKKCGGL